MANIPTLLIAIERAGNRLPHPTLLFLYLAVLVLLGSALASGLQLTALHPVTGETIHATNLLSRYGLQQFLNEAISNFTGFAPVGTVLVAIMGIGVAEHSGLLSVVLRLSVLRAPQKWLTFIVVLLGVLSSLAADTGYVVLIPLAAIIFQAAGRSPITGMAAAFAGVSGGYSANVLIGPIDALLAGISTEAAQLLAPGYEVNAAANYYFMATSTLLIAAVGTWVTEKIVAPSFNPESHNSATGEAVSDKDVKALKAVFVFSVLVVGLLLAGLLPTNGTLRDPTTGSILNSPFIKGVVLIIAVYAALAGALFGKVSGRFTHNSDIVLGMEKSMETLASYLVLMFFAAQFVALFNWSQLGLISAVHGAGFLQSLGLQSHWLLIGFVLLAALINLFIGSASAKWALMGPVFVPMLMPVGISPEASQLAFRLGDSCTNIITPLMPYFGVVVAFMQRYKPNAGVGTVIAAMLPYSISFLLAWSVLLVLWLTLGLPLGPSSYAAYSAG